MFGCRSQRGRHSTKYTEEMEDKELLADEEGGKDVRMPRSNRCLCVHADGQQGYQSTWGSGQQRVMARLRRLERPCSGRGVMWRLVDVRLSAGWTLS